MSDNDIYGEGLGKRLKAEANSFVTRAFPKALLAVTELRYDKPEFVLSTPPTDDEAFQVAVHLDLYERYEYWEDGKAAPVSTIRPGDTIIYDIGRKPTFHLNSKFHSMHFYVPTLALDAIADDAGSPRIDGLRYRPAVSHDDPVLHRIAQALLAVMDRQETVSRVFLDNLMLAVGHHVAVTYGGMQPMRSPQRGGLAPGEERRAKELLCQDLSGNMPLADVAQACGLSISQFIRAFRISVGMPPHRWLIERRIETAKSLLRDDKLSLALIALACGFSDQSHFTRCFAARVGLSPGAWRRNVRD
jgi:AraC family transcriptional regulator